MSFTGFPTEKETAPLHKRYIGLFHYSVYFNKWDKIIGITTYEWIVQSVDLDGKSIGPIRRHCTPMHNQLFANQPFTAHCFNDMLTVR